VTSTRASKSRRAFLPSFLVIALTLHSTVCAESDSERSPAPPPASTNIAPQPVPNRWKLGLTWERYEDKGIEAPYDHRTYLWHPYEQSVLKGDVPIYGQDVFLNLTVFNVTEFEARSLPKPSGVSAARPSSAEFFGNSEEWFVNNNTGLRVDLFQGETSFKPVEWRLRLETVYNVNYTCVEETNILDVDPRGDGFQRKNKKGLDPLPSDLSEKSDYTERLATFLALQEAFAEIHIADLSPNYDFLSSKFGLQSFVSDFRGFIFYDTNLGERLFGNAFNNRLQYNVIGFQMREKDTFSGLNEFDGRDQEVLIANAYWQDFLKKGYTAQLSFHANFDGGATEYDRAGFLVRPAPIGTVQEHEVQAWYLGWAGDGHLGRLNLTHAFYQVFGEDELNGLAGKEVDINAQMFALELSYDKDWLRPKLSFFYASGDPDAEDGEANGFDTILDNPNFVGAPFSYYVRQGFNLAGTSVNLKQRDSLVPNLRTSKTQGQSNFVNPGILIFGAGLDVDVTPKLRTFLNANYIRFVETSPIEVALFDQRVREELGYDVSIGCIYRPFLTDNVIITAGFGVLIPGEGFRDIYRAAETPVPGYGSGDHDGATDSFYYSGLLSITLTY
jgi:hypothetical protein